MSGAAREAVESVHFLREGARLLSSLSDELFVRPVDAAFRGGVGSQFRHCIDFYECFLRGLGAGRIDYAARDRDPRIETERQRSAESLERLARRLESLSVDVLEREVRVRCAAADGENTEAGWSRSTVRRELDFLASHTVHHYALIVVLLTGLGHPPGPEFADFGVAPSTLDHWKRSGSPAP